MTGDLCRVCGDELTENQATCHQCGKTFHLALRIDVSARDCGDAWIDDEVQALMFGCDVCLGRGQPAETARRRYARRPGARASEVARTRRSGRGGRLDAS